MMHPRVEFTEAEYDAHMTNMERLVAVALDGRGSGWDKAATTPSTSGWAPLADNLGWQVFSSKLSDARGDQEYVCFGSIPSSLAGIQRAHYVRNTDEFQVLNAVVYENMHVDAAVLNVTHGRSEEDPGQFFGVKYVKLSVPVMNDSDQPQSYLYIELSGTRVDSHGRLTFFVATDPVSILESCPTVGIAIPSGALCASITLYRDSMDGRGVDVLMRTKFDAVTSKKMTRRSMPSGGHHNHGGGASSGGSVAAMMKRDSQVTLWKAMAMFIPSALAKDLFGVAKLATLPESRRLAAAPAAAPKDQCKKCCVCFKGFNMLRRKSHCRRCALSMCTGCTVQLYCTAPSTAAMPGKFCKSCLLQAKVDAMAQLPTPHDYLVDRREIDRSGPVVHLKHPVVTSDTFFDVASRSSSSMSFRMSASGSNAQHQVSSQPLAHTPRSSTGPTEPMTTSQPSTGTHIVVATSARATFGDLSDALFQNPSNSRTKRSANEPSGSLVEPAVIHPSPPVDGGAGAAAAAVAAPLPDDSPSVTLATEEAREVVVDIDAAAWTRTVRELALVRLHGVVVDPVAPELGSGAVTRVRLGTYNDQRVAIKSLFPVANAALVRQLVGEIQLLRQFDSQFIIKALGASWGDQGCLDEVVEFMDGGTLAAALTAPAALPWPDKLATLQRVVEGLVYLHSCQVVHRDLKAKSVLLDGRHGAKLGGFGRARDEVDHDDDDDLSVATAPSAPWLAPELVQGDLHSWESDIYAFGVLVVEVAAHSTRASLATDKSPLDVLSSLQDACPSWLVDSTRQCLSVRPADRPTACALSYMFHQKFQPPPPHTKTKLANAEHGHLSAARSSSTEPKSTKQPTVQSSFLAKSRSSSHLTSPQPAQSLPKQSQSGSVGQSAAAAPQPTPSKSSTSTTGSSSSTQPLSTTAQSQSQSSTSSSSTNPLTTTSSGAAFDGVARLDETQLALVSRLGSGAFGDVWLATYQGEPVAVKKMHPHMVTPDQVRGFLAEINLMSQFDSPYIVNVLGASWTTLSDVQCVMELMNGGDLGDRLAATTPDTFSWPDKLAILVNVIEALCDVHDINVIHRDLKSRNVLLDSAKPAKLTDFGISRENLEQTMTNGMGTCRWMAPEVIEGNQYTVSADIYSFGMILSEMDRHEIPFKSTKNKNGTAMLDTQIMLGVVSGKLKPTFSEDCPDWVTKMALECVATDPDDRPPAYKLSHALRTIQRRMAMP